jgi:AcrR family transcriptional regulator
MTIDSRGAAGKPALRKLSRAERRIQLLDTALLIVQDEGADRLTMGRLAERAGVSKPVAYDHFRTRAELLVELYRELDMKQLNALKDALTLGKRSPEGTAQLLAGAYIHCSADTSGEWHAVGAALAGSKEMDAVHQDLLDVYAELFTSVLKPYSTLSMADLKRHCIGLIGAGEALSAAMVRGNCSEGEAADTFSSLIKSGLHTP